MFSEFQEQANIVVLGDPGAGKTHLFRHFAEREAGRFLTVRSFLNLPTVTAAGPLFVDALDERRSGRGDHATIDALVQKLFTINPAKVRISCRALDWLGETDLAALRDYFDVKGGYVVLGLDELTVEERDAIIGSEGFGNPTAFAADATDRHLQFLLSNPQNLIMLCRVMKTKGWPATRTDLFQRMTELLLTEHNERKTHAGGGVYCADELEDAAGAICAVRLISDVAAVSRAEASGDIEVPTYRTLDCEDLEKIAAALGRRIFVSVSGSEAVDYAHRTIAEFLAAAWLAKRVRNGLPLGRVRALIGIGGHPAPELRGLHAWLAVQLPEYAEPLIDADPYGVLTYGDVASQSLPLRRYLLSALGKLSQTDPWFRSGSWSLSALGTLATPDMAAAFSSVLQSKTANFAHRSCVLEALAVGRPVPQLQPDLMKILVDPAAPYAERSYALEALAKLGPQAEAEIVRAGTVDINKDGDGLRLRADIVALLYERYYRSADIGMLLSEVLRSDDDVHVGSLRQIVPKISLQDVMAILDVVPQAEKKGRQSRSERRNAIEVLYLIDELVVRALDEAADRVDGRRLWTWLRARRRLRDGGVYTGSDFLKRALTRQPDVLLQAVAAAVDELVVDDDRWRFIHRLREATLHVVDEYDLLEQLLACTVASNGDRSKQAFLYELALLLSLRPTERALTVVGKLQTFAAGRADLEEILTRNLSCPLEAWREEDAQRRARSTAEKEENRARNLREFAESRDAIQRGAHYGWMEWLGDLYLGRFNDVEKSATPRERLAGQLGDENAQIALDGLVAVAFRDDIPSLGDITRTLREGKYYKLASPLVAGLDEASSQQLDMSGIAKSTLQAALVMGTERLILGGEKDKRRTWKSTFLEQEPALARDGYLALVRSGLAREKSHVDGVHSLLNDAHLAPFRKDVSLELLREFPNAAFSVLEDLLQAALATSEAHADLSRLSHDVLKGNGALGAEQRQLWLAAAYLLEPSKYEPEISAGNDPVMVWRLRDLSGTDARRRRKAGQPLSLGQLTFLAGFTAGHFANTDHPKNGWSSSQNPWDGADYVRSLISQISTVPSADATQALSALERAGALGSYSDHIKHALANQRARRREVEYRQPDWAQTIQALKNGSPAGVSDLHALLVAYLADIKVRIAGSNTDIFKRFWNEDAHGRPTEPKVEESCRDVLMDLLKPALVPLGIALEPEGHMVSDKRADFVALCVRMKIVAELKRDTHADVWTAIESQLDRLYTRDPDAAGYGLYVVFWYGDKRKGRVPVGPNDQRPASAANLERMLRELVSEDKKERIAVIVLDVSCDRGGMDLEQAGRLGHAR